MKVIILLFIFLMQRPIFLNSSTIYVKHDAAGLNNGTSWANAYTSLQSALSAAVDNDKIWVAKGTYKPSISTRTESFVLKSNVEVYGGFLGNEASDYDKSLRNFTTNETILDGNIGSLGDATDNSYHIVYANAITNPVLDGFTISNGNADGTDDDQSGAGVFLSGTNGTFRNLKFTNNNTTNFGSGIYNEEGDCTFNNITFSNNGSSGLYGGALVNYGSGDATVTINNLTLNNNTKCGIINLYVTATMDSITISNNSNSPGIHNESSTVDISYLVVNNHTGESAVKNLLSTVDIIYSKFGNNSSTWGTVYNYNSTVTLSNCLLYKNQAFFGGGITNGSNTGLKNITLTNLTIADNTATTGGGIANENCNLNVYNASSTPKTSKNL